MSDSAPNNAARRPRRANPLRFAAQEVAAADAKAAEEAVAQVEEISTQRPPMRSSMREESPRERAKRRAAEVRNNLGDMEEGPDDFYIDQKSIPDGWSYEWKRKTVWGQEDPAYQIQLARMGWEPVPANRHPSYMPDTGGYKTIERKGMILMERPKELTDEAKNIELKKARNQVRQKEAQLSSAAGPDQFGRDNKGSPMVKINKSYDAIPIPNE
jgi:hypothetical protein